MRATYAVVVVDIDDSIKYTRWKRVMNMMRQYGRTVVQVDSCVCSRPPLSREGGWEVSSMMDVISADILVSPHPPSCPEGQSSFSVFVCKFMFSFNASPCFSNCSSASCYLFYQSAWGSRNPWWQGWQGLSHFLVKYFLSCSCFGAVFNTFQTDWFFHDPADGRVWGNQWGCGCCCKPLTRKFEATRWFLKHMLVNIANV